MINNEFPFNPFFLFQSPLIQTLMGWLLNIPTKPKSSTKIIDLPDDDKIAMQKIAGMMLKDSLPGVLLIIGDSNKFACYVECGWEDED